MASQAELEARIEYLERAVKALLHPVAMGIWKAQVVEGGGGGDQGPGGGNDIQDQSPGSGDSGATPGTTVVTADPGNLYSGMIWVRSDLHQVRWSEAGTKYQVTGTAV